MNPLTLEWVQKAEGDYAAAQWLQQAAAPMCDAICFHARQSIEKYLKAWLQELFGRSIPDLTPAFEQFVAGLKARAEASAEEA
ncbi:MAG: HEPN domain-containing protein [Candidatus Latescibacteria bacterium]|nr:HEPN domain-containing protein [Candidatus Latescibacterota bacterium]